MNYGIMARQLPRKLEHNEVMIALLYRLVAVELEMMILE